jgi:alpha-tubulin suppressor-like RCC1 family protein
MSAEPQGDRHVRRTVTMAAVAAAFVVFAVVQAVRATETGASATRSGPRALFAVAHRARCEPGHLQLALLGPREVLARHHVAYVFVARACRGTRSGGLVRVRLSVSGPQRLHWLIRRLRAASSVRRKFAFRFPDVSGSAAARRLIVTLEARSSRNRLIARRRVTIYVRGVPRPATTLSTTTVGWGVNIRGEVGAGYTSPPLTMPVRGRLRGVRELATGESAGYALLEDGTVRAWGGNSSGQLGDGSRFEKLNPTPVPGLTGVVQIAAYGAHALALLGNGTVYTWGGNFWGTLGNGTRDSVEGEAHPIPTQVPGLQGAVAIGAGGADDFAILSNGTVVAWGENKSGQLGDGTTQTKLVPTPVRALADVRAVAFGGVSSHGGHMLALLGDGRVMVAGQNDHGQLGLGDTTDRALPTLLPGVSGVTSVSASGSHSLATLADGALLSWGNDQYGELGYATSESCSTAPCGKIPRAVGIGAVSNVAAGLRFSVAVSGGHVFSWGANEYGQLGDGTMTASTTPVELGGVAGIGSVSAGERFTLAIAAAGPSPDFSLRPGPGELIAEWAPQPGNEPWSLSWRPFSRPPVSWSKPLVLPAATTSYVIGGLSKVQYEVRLGRVQSSFTYRIASATPE